MSNIRVDVDYALRDGLEMKFRSPVDCSQITGLIVYYPGEDGNITSKVFALADAHGNNVGDIDHLFAEDVVVKVILDVTTSMAFVQNADTNAYLEAQLASKRPNTWLPTIAEIGAAPAGYGLGEKCITVSSWDDATKSGFYHCEGWSGYVTAHAGGDISQERFGQMSGKMYKQFRWFCDGSWKEWEWVNPPMQQEYEYRTTERAWGGPVYKKIFYYGILPVGQSSANHGIVGLTQVIKVTLLSHGLQTLLNHHPGITQVDVDAEKIYITNSDGTICERNCFVLMEYSKT